MQIGDIGLLALTGLIEKPLFVAPTNGIITKVTFTNGADLLSALTAGTLSISLSGVFTFLLKYDTIR